MIPPLGNSSVSLKHAALGLEQPAYVTHTGDECRMIVERMGRI